MKKKLVILLVLLLCLPLCAKGELKYEKKDNFNVDFPELDGLRCGFLHLNTWTFVTADNLDEHLDLVLARGGSEEEARERFAAETLVFEAYSPTIPSDTCYRLECFENDYTHKIWNLSQWDQDKKMEVKGEIGDGKVLPQYDIFNMMISVKSSDVSLNGWYTNHVPDAHEGGRIKMAFCNGRLYVLSCAIYGRLSAGERHLNTEDQEANVGYLASFRGPQRPRPANLELNDLWPVHANVENSPYLPATFTDLYPDMKDTCHSVTYTGTIEWGTKLSVTLDGEDVPVEMKDKYNFSVELPMKTAGDHQAVFTLSSDKYQDMSRTVTIRATEDYAPLIFTALPETYIKTGEHEVAGKTAPCATVTLRMDGADPIKLTVDENGEFTHTLTIEDDEIHTLRVEAAIPGRQTTCYEKEFVAEFADAMAAIKDFEKSGVTETRFDKILEDPNAHIGERVKASVWIREVELINGEGLSARCMWDYEKYTGQYWWQREDPGYADLDYLYLKVPSYTQDGLYKDMMIEVYGTVIGTHPYTNPEGVTTDVLEIEADFVTYYE